MVVKTRQQKPKITSQWLKNIDSTVLKKRSLRSMQKWRDTWSCGAQTRSSLSAVATAHSLLLAFVALTLRYDIAAALLGHEPHNWSWVSSWWPRRQPWRHVLYADSAKICNKSVKGTRCVPYFLRVLLKMAVFKSFKHTIPFWNISFPLRWCAINQIRRNRRCRRYSRTHNIQLLVLLKYQGRASPNMLPSMLGVTC